jgi:hypothetical protein
METILFFSGYRNKRHRSYHPFRLLFRSPTSLCQNCLCRWIQPIHVQSFQGGIHGNESLWHTQIPKIYRKKIFYLIRIYNILIEKYSFGITDLNKALSRSHFFDKAEIDDLLHFLNSNKNEESLEKLFLMMKKLMGVIFAEGKTEAREDIYYKRHVAAGIPSMYTATATDSTVADVIQGLFTDMQTNLDPASYDLSLVGGKIQIIGTSDFSVASNQVKSGQPTIEFSVASNTLSCNCFISNLFSLRYS